MTSIILSDLAPKYSEVFIWPRKFEHFKKLKKLTEDDISQTFLQTTFQCSPMILCGNSSKNIWKLLQWIIQSKIKNYNLYYLLPILIYFKYTFFKKIVSFGLRHIITISNIFESWFAYTFFKFLMMLQS
jgi:hypothetical protein